MYCTKCGVELRGDEIYCSKCGAGTERAPKPRYTETRPLTRSRYENKIAGVCAGVAHYLDIDVTLVRIIWLVLTFTPPSVGLIAYIVAWIVMPKEPPRLAESQVAYQS